MYNEVENAYYVHPVAFITSEVIRYIGPSTFGDIYKHPLWKMLNLAWNTLRWGLNMLKADDLIVIIRKDEGSVCYLANKDMDIRSRRLDSEEIREKIRRWLKALCLIDDTRPRPGVLDFLVVMGEIPTSIYEIRSFLQLCNVSMPRIMCIEEHVEGMVRQGIIQKEYGRYRREYYFYLYNESVYSVDDIIRRLAIDA